MQNGVAICLCAAAVDHQHSNVRHYDHASKGVVILSRRQRILVEEHKDPSLTLRMTEVLSLRTVSPPYC